MSLMHNIAKYLENSTDYSIDSTIFVGAEVYEVPAKAIIVTETPGGTRNESNLEQRAIQILCMDRSVIDAETLAFEIFELMAHAPGFSDNDLANENIFYCDPVALPQKLARSQGGSFIYFLNFTIWKGA